MNSNWERDYFRAGLEVCRLRGKDFVFDNFSLNRGSLTVSVNAARYAGKTLLGGESCFRVLGRRVEYGRRLIDGGSPLQ